MTFYGTDSSTTATTTATWVQWNDEYCDVGIVEGSYTWTAWNQVSTVTTTSSTNTVWYYWNSSAAGSLNPVVIVPKTAEELAEIARIAREKEAEYARIAAEAEARADELLRANLNSGQREEFERDKTFTVISKEGQRRYRIRKGWSHNVECIDVDGRLTATLCAHPVESVPALDNMLAQKLMLEHDEERFLKIANRRAIGA